MFKKAVQTHYYYYCFLLLSLYVDNNKPLTHIVQFGKFPRIGGSPPKTFPSVKYDAPEEARGDRKCFDSPIRK